MLAQRRVEAVDPVRHRFVVREEPADGVREQLRTERVEDLVGASPGREQRPQHLTQRPRSGDLPAPGQGLP